MSKAHTFTNKKDEKCYTQNEKFCLLNLVDENSELKISGVIVYFNFCLFSLHL